MKKTLFAILSIISLSQCYAQTLLVDKAYSKGYDKTVSSVVEISDGRFAFLSSRSISGGTKTEESPYLKGEVFVFLTDNFGNVEKSKIILPDTGIATFLPDQIFLNQDKTLSIIGSSFNAVTGLVSSFIYLQIDTNLNLLKYKVHSFTFENAELLNFKFTQSDNKLYGAITYYYNRALPYPHSRTMLVKLTEQGDVVKTQNMDSSFFGVKKYFYPAAYSIRNGFSKANLSLIASYAVSDTVINRKYIDIFRDQFLLYKIDTNLKLIDTSSVPFVQSSKSIDTSLVPFRDFTGCIEVSEGNYLLGAVQSLYSSSKKYNSSGLVKFNLPEAKINAKSILPFDSKIDIAIQYNAFVKNLAFKDNKLYSSVNSYYSGAYMGGNNYLTVVKYDTNAKIIWYKRFGEAGYLNGWNITACNDGNIMVLATSYDGNADNERDFFIFRLDSATGIPLSIANVSEQLRSGITVYPNPAQNEINIKGAAAGSAISISNIAGQTVLKEKIIGNAANSFSVAHLAAGTYIYTITDTKGQKTSSGKWIKQ